MKRPHLWRDRLQARRGWVVAGGVAAVVITVGTGGAAAVLASSDTSRVAATPSTAAALSPTATPTASVTPTMAPTPAPTPTAASTPKPAAVRATPRASARPSASRAKVSVRVAPSATASVSRSVAGQVLLLVNQERAKVGCRALSANASLQRAAQGHSTDMATNDYFSHTSLDGRTFADRIRAAGYVGSLLAENIAAGQPTASTVMAGWMSSPGHRANILNCAYTSLGVGLARGGTYGYYWTQDFGG